MDDHFICSVCQNFLAPPSEDFDVDAEENLHTRKSVYHSAMLGCRICTVLTKIFCPKTDVNVLYRFDRRLFDNGTIHSALCFGRWKIPQGPETVHHKLPTGRSRKDLYFNLFHEVNGAESVASVLKFPTSNPTAAYGFSFRSQPLATNTGSGDSLKFITSWLSQCFNNHTDCTIPSPKCLSALPTRLIDVEEMRLKELNEADKETIHCIQYWTLSHRWNEQDEPSKSCTKNFYKRTRKINASELSRLYLNTIELTKRLGGRYLWIDSLCII
jgi:hypothetical protein